ncbi:MAG TPA: T9SS type A sorting domain-containing protein [Ignavibacteriaceae bacterium]|nr:T9SS type A sorting domain-containing protein [Ignavibacteriaceae bacterium]
MKIVPLITALLLLMYCSAPHKTTDEISNQYKLTDETGNPFSPSTTIIYDLREDQNVSLIIFDINGNPVDTLVNSFQMKGNYQIKPNFFDNESGLYFYKLETEDTTYVKKMLILK